MTTWISRSSALLALIALAGCEPGAGGFGTAPPKQVRLSAGNTLVAAPRGYCVDRTSVTARFALIARCDVLGAEGGQPSRPLGVITVSLTDLPASEKMPTPGETAAALNLLSLSNPVEQGSSVVFQASGRPPSDLLSDRHWRAMARIGNQLVGLAFYGPAAAGRLDATGRSLLLEMITATEQGND
jgi:hypothetical protein